MPETKSEVSIPHQDQFDLKSPEFVARRNQRLSDLIENRILSGYSGHELPNIGKKFDNLPVVDKANRLYEKLITYHAGTRLRKESPAQENDRYNRRIRYVKSEIKSLWSDEKTREAFLSKFTTARIDAKLQRQSQTGKDWKRINEEIDETRTAYESESRELFLGLVDGPLEISAAEGMVEGLADELIKLQNDRERLLALADLPHTPENTDMAALINYEMALQFHKQGKEGFVWEPSRLAIQQQIKDVIKSGKYPLLIGPPGTGKTSQVTATAIELTGEPPVSVDCTSSSGVHDLIADKDIRRGDSYRQYKGIGRAFTGFADSEATEKECGHGRVVELNEVSEMNIERGLAPIKGAAAKKPGAILHEEVKRPVLPGSTLIATSNAPITDERFDREFGRVPINYFGMTDTSPELFEYMRDMLLTDTGNIRAARIELAPFFDRVEVAGDEKLPDGRRIIAKEHLIKDPADPRHGTLYRLAFAIRALQDTYIHGSAYNEKHMANTAFYYDFDNNGAIRINNYITDLKDPAASQNVSGEMLTLNAGSSTLTVKQIEHWMKDFNKRGESSDPKDHTPTFTDWVKLKLEKHIAQASSDDAEKIRAIFGHFHLFDNPPDIKDSLPLTPKEIGYLSPRVPRPVEVVSGEEEKPDDKKQEQNTVKDHKPHKDLACMLTDGTTILVLPAPLEFEKDNKTIRMKSGRRFKIGNDKFCFVGFKDPDNAVVRIDSGHKDEALHKIIPVSELQQTGEFKNQIEDMKELFGEDFPGAEAVKKTFGYEVPEELIPDAIYDRFTGGELTYEDLERAKELGMFPILRIDKIPRRRLSPFFDRLLSTVVQENIPLTMEFMNNLLTPQFKNESKGKILLEPDRYKDVDFFNLDTPEHRWALVSKDILPASLNKNYLEQTQVIADYLTNEVFKGKSLPPQYLQAIEEFKREEPGIAALLSSDWRKAAEKLSELKLNQLTRRTPVEVLYDFVMRISNSGERLLENKYDWTQGRSSDGYLVGAGGFGSGGADLDDWGPSNADPSIGVVLSR